MLDSRQEGLRCKSAEFGRAGAGRPDSRFERKGLGAEGGVWTSGFLSLPFSFPIRPLQVEIWTLRGPSLTHAATSVRSHTPGVLTPKDLNSQFTLHGFLPGGGLA